MPPFVKPEYFRVFNIKALFLVPFFVLVLQTQAQTAPIIESGKFRLHKFEQPIGEETYEITRESNSLVITKY